MIKVSKLADYGVVVMGTLADMQAAAGPTMASVTTGDISARTHLPMPTVAKVLKLLAKSRLVKSERGAQGGYLIARAPETITLAQIVSAVDGPVMLTECAEGMGSCTISDHCALKGRWGAVNRVVAQALSDVTLDHLMHPIVPALGVAQAQGTAA